MMSQDESPNGYFCIIPNTNLAALIVFKNACTFLNSVAIYNATSVWENHKRVVHVKSHAFGYLIPVDKMAAYEAEHGERIKFAVWRDPVERAVSAYTHFCLDGFANRYLEQLNIKVGTSFDEYVRFLKFELGKKDAQQQDGHLRRQSDYYTPDMVDEIVELEDLTAFLTQHGAKFVDEKVNGAKVKFKIESELNIAKVKEYYASDYLIKSTWIPDDV